MTNNQHNRLNMIQSVHNYLNNNITIINTNVPTMATKILLDQKIAELLAHHAIQLQNSTGIAEDKKNKRAILMQKALALSALICAYASIGDNTALYNENHFTKSGLILLSDYKLTGVCGYLVISLENNLASLQPFGIDANDIINFKNAIDSFAAVINTPSKSITKRNKSTQAIANLLTEITTLLEQRLDNNLVVFETAHPMFVGTYRKLRRVGKTPTRTLDLVVQTISKTNQQPIEKAKLKIADKKGFRLSSKMGKNIFLNLKQGQHQLTVSHPNYQTKTVDFTVVDNETTKIVVALEENEIDLKR
jgi:hypothetical protein